MAWYTPYSTALLLSCATLSQSQVQVRSNGYDPGIRAVTPASIEAEKQAEAAWLSHLQILASDTLKGRRTGSPEFLQAVQYVEDQFKSIGLRPAGTAGFRQPVAFRSVSVDVDKSNFELIDPDGTTNPIKPGDDLLYSPNAEGSVSFEAPAVFVGYGLEVPVLGVDDLKAVDLHGKIAVLFLAAPTAVHGPLKAYYRTVAMRWRSLRDAGAVGVIAIQIPRPEQENMARRTDPAGRRPIHQLADPALDSLEGSRVSATVKISGAGPLFSRSPHTVKELTTLAREGKLLPSFDLGLKVRAVVTTEVISKYEAPNLIAELEGSDPKLKHEYLILSAHLDHLGEGRAVDGDSIYNGAMDNAVGIASLIETAKALAKGPRPKRSILFLALTGEEEGELGSQFYARYPTVPRSHIVADLNMDMYLPLFPLRFLEVQGLGESTLGNDARAAAQRNDIEVQFDKQPDENRFIRSDQASFVKYGIPGLAFKFGWLPDSPEQKTFNDWIHNRYHHPNDDLNQPIDREAAVHFDQVLQTLTLSVANARQAPAWYPQSFFSTIARH